MTRSSRRHSSSIILANDSMDTKVPDLRKIFQPEWRRAFRKWPLILFLKYVLGIQRNNSHLTHKIHRPSLN